VLQVLRRGGDQAEAAGISALVLVASNEPNSSRACLPRIGLGSAALDRVRGALGDAFDLVAEIILESAAIQRRTQERSDAA
jgi:hypothetical protein